jgi:transcriptional regulator of heat shock response
MDPNKFILRSRSAKSRMETCSLVTSTYSYKGEVWVPGVIGPSDELFEGHPLVDYTAKLLTEILDAS